MLVFIYELRFNNIIKHISTDERRNRKLRKLPNLSEVTVLYLIILLVSHTFKKLTQNILITYFILLWGNFLDF